MPNNKGIYSIEVKLYASQTSALDGGEWPPLCSDSLWGKKHQFQLDIIPSRSTPSLQTATTHFTCWPIYYIKIIYNCKHNNTNDTYQKDNPKTTLLVTHNRVLYKKGFSYKKRCYLFRLDLPNHATCFDAKTKCYGKNSSIFLKYNNPKRAVHNNYSKQHFIFMHDTQQ